MRLNDFIQRSRLHTRTRSGFSVLEMFVSGILLAAILSALGPTVYWIQRTQRVNERQQFAVLELSNQMERIFAQASPVSAESLSQLTLSEFAEGWLPDAAIGAELSGAGAGRKVSLTLAWTDDSGQTVRPLVLTAWLPEPEKSTETAAVARRAEGSL